MLGDVLWKMYCIIHNKHITFPTVAEKLVGIRTFLRYGVLAVANCQNYNLLHGFCGYIM